MKKIIIGMALCAIVVFASCDLVMPVADMHGDTIDTATRFSVGESRSGVLNSSSDQDWFLITVPREGVVFYETTGSTDTFGRLQLPVGVFGNGRTFLEHDDIRLGINRNFRFAITHEGPANTFPRTIYLRVTGYRGATGNYTVRARYE